MPNKLKAGAAQVDITPPVGISMGGYFHDRKAQAIHDPLFAKVLVLANDDSQLALVACDLLGLEGETVARIRQLIKEQSGIPEDNTLICASHIHSGPQTLHIFGGTIDENWMPVLTDKLAGVVRVAKSNLQNTKIGIGVGYEDSIVFNRRYKMKDGTEATNPGKGNPNVIEPAGPIDPQVGVLKIEDLAGNLIALLVNYTNHVDVVGGSSISADYPGVMAKTIQKIKGESTVVLFTNGAFANINHIDINNPDQKEGFEEAERMGIILGAEILKVAEKVQTKEDCKLHAAHQILDIPIRKPSTKQLDEAKQTLKTEEWSLEKVYANELMELSRMGETCQVEISAIAIDKNVVIGVPGELFVEFGLEIKERSGFEHTFIIGLANGYVGYIPTLQAFEKGGYEPRLARSSKLIPQAGELIVSAALNLIKGLPK